VPKQNRVTPFGELIATPERGMLTGNRGCLHDADGRIRRRYQGQRWIICLLEFKGRKRPIMTPGCYTELFFLDEATALAAGHRPCAECQRQRFNLFRDTWAKANPELAEMLRPSATLLDAALHLERTVDYTLHRLCTSIKDLPNGVLISDDGQNAYLVLQNQLLRWTPGGYEQPGERAVNYPARILTPASVVRTFRAGYPPGIHPSAWQVID